MMTSFVAVTSCIAFISWVFVIFVTALARFAHSIIRRWSFTSWMLSWTIRLTWVTTTITTTARTASFRRFFVLSTQRRATSITFAMMMLRFGRWILWSSTRRIRIITVVLITNIILFRINSRRLMLWRILSNTLTRHICQLTICYIVH